MDEEFRIGGADDLPERVVFALTLCSEQIGKPPTAKKYDQWRAQLVEEERQKMPSLTAIVPIAYPTWADAREAAGIDSSVVQKSSHGPIPRWTREQCLRLVREWLGAGGSGTIAAFTGWIDQQRETGRDVPSTSTIRLRLRKPWSQIVAEAASMVMGTDA